ncbi:hypothetical protein HMPREF9444_02143 [Succinatimonas hippei YIT 12066]|uniref:Uncharacterized protein n=1 Tax=Succinatimonas hippei (strain DSM 22608 / JCM 16073 / KCTC 15190 / YIT 12066) TaxID=762983 RepID=E8LMZ1_SUCHY|nr:hypothetical protein HMPREF9444_02143 [Succinatimonas hippei YIT 12066]
MMQPQQIFNQNQLRRAWLKSFDRTGVLCRLVCLMKGGTVNYRGYRILLAHIMR